MLADFHFLRPLWLLLVLLLPLMYLAFRQLHLGDSGWSRLIPARLLSPVIRHEGTSGRTSKSPMLPAAIALVVLATALAGPAWREAPTPLKQPGDSLVIALDLSLSMLATDVEPDRLTRAKRKIRDILAVRQGSLTGLLVYAGDAHVVTPLTDDTRTIEGMLDVLDPVIMPATGNRADLAIARAADLLTQGAPGDGRILIITDQISERYWPEIRDTLSETGYALNSLVVGTEEGGPIPLARRGFIRENGEIVISRATPDALSELARSTGGQSHELTLNNTDIESLELSPKDTGGWQDTSAGLTVSRWQDDGYWLLWLAAPLILLGWRRGAFTALALVLLPAFPQPAAAMTWADLWQRQDQRAPELIQNDPKQAAARLDDPEWKGSALYRSGQYDAAAQVFSRAEGPRASYNRGNALARAGKLEEALAAYNHALAESPDMEDARHNLKIVEELLKQKNQGNGDSQSNKQKDPSESPGSDGNKPQDNQSQPGNDKNPGDSGNEQQQNSGNSQRSSGNREEPGEQNREPDRQRDEQEGQTPEQVSGEQESQTNQPRAPAPISETPLTQSQEQSLRRVPDNPGGLLQRKFLQQYQQRQTPSDEGDTPW
ncbi:VWA domain-containing protein [Marinobacter sp. Arc7-DN-1]|uniref:VWA domain-containing protein n=1 Tax=Marinobacter sp. Arc7-DN-1 TaxID=2304594 RepID=UPI000E452562|nr:VWA domain-containing protein [Marinobacter sp. Arc7-DN-1]AXS82378.1 VWA domain-containing protein [Marinobacter sp. Arc7-DN-1]